MKNRFSKLVTYEVHKDSPTSSIHREINRIMHAIEELQIAVTELERCEAIEQEAVRMYVAESKALKGAFAAEEAATRKEGVNNVT